MLKIAVMITAQRYLFIFLLISTMPIIYVTIANSMKMITMITEERNALRYAVMLYIAAVVFIDPLIEMLNKHMTRIDRAGIVSSCDALPKAFFPSNFGSSLPIYRTKKYPA